MEPIVFTAVAAAIVLAVVEALKQVGLVEKFFSLTALVVGVVLGITWQIWGDPFAPNMFMASVSGFLAAASAVGLYDGTRSTARKLGSGPPQGRSPFNEPGNL